MDKTTARELHDALQQTSWKVLDAVGCLREPHKPKVRTRKWADDQGPDGIAIHYTGGPSGLASMRWFNHPGWGNTSSSAQFLIFDRMPDNPAGEVWSRDTEVRRWFPVPTVMLADTRWSTWCTDWANKHVLGVENRNAGYNSKHLAICGKEPAEHGGVAWEPYTREQMVCNVNLGRLFCALRGEKLDPDWIIGHSMVNAAKRDPGPDFPMHAFRDAVFSDEPLERLTWLDAFPAAPVVREDDEADWEGDQEERDAGDLELLSFGVPRPIEDPEELANLLYPLGYNVGHGVPDDERLRKFTLWFQLATRALATTKPDRVLAADGDPGPRTQAELRRRLKELRLEPREA